MKFLLDTNIFLWFLNGEKKLLKKHKEIIENAENEIFLSIASIWEIAIKDSLGKVELKYDFNLIFPKVLLNNDIRILDIEISHLKKLRVLPFYHKDPFDRIIISQATAEKIELLYTDEAFLEYFKI